MLVIQAVAVLTNIFLLTSIIIRHLLYFQWLQAKKFITKYDTMGNTGLWKNLVIEIVVNLIMPYPFLNDYVYYEDYNSKILAKECHIEFRINSILLCFMTFIRLY